MVGIMSMMIRAGIGLYLRFLLAAFLALLCARPARSQTRASAEIGVSALNLFLDRESKFFFDLGASYMAGYIGVDINLAMRRGEPYFLGGLLLGTNVSKPVVLFGEAGFLTGLYFDPESSWILGGGVKVRASRHLLIMFRGLDWISWVHGSSFDIGLRFSF